MSEFLGFYIWQKYYNDWKKETKEKISFEGYMQIQILHQLRSMKYDLEEIERLVETKKGNEKNRYNPNKDPTKCKNYNKNAIECINHLCDNGCWELIKK